VIARIAVGIAALLLGLAGVAVLALLRDDPKPQAFRLQEDYDTGVTSLVWRDGAKPLSLGVNSVGYLLSPDGRTAVFGSQWDDRLRFADLVTRKLSNGPRTTRFPAPVSSCAATPHAWFDSGRIVATGWCGDAHRTSDSTLAAIRPDGTVSIRPVGWGPVLTTKNRAIFLASPPPGPFVENSYAREERLGRARLIKVEPNGSIARAVLRIRVGMSDSRTHKRFPGFAVRRDRAVVVSEDEGSAEIDLRTMRIRYHPVSFPARPQRLSPPPLRHEGTANPARDLTREAHWLNDRHVAVSGYDIWTKDHHDRMGGAGLWLLDTETWTAKRIDPDASDIHVAAGTMLAWSVLRSRHGLRAYDEDGRLLFRRFNGRDVALGGVRGGEATVHVYGAFDFRRQMPTDMRTFAVDLRSGRVQPLER
jgi:hypothetical protein